MKGSTRLSARANRRHATRAPVRYFDEQHAVRGRRELMKGRRSVLRQTDLQQNPGAYGLDFSAFAVFERLFLRTPVRLMRARNNVLDLMFYDVDVIPAATKRQLLAWTDPDGSVLVVHPGNGAQRKVTHFEHVEDFLSSKVLRSTEIVAIAGVGSSALGTAALAANVADALGRPVVGIVSGYGLVDAVAEGVMGWYVLRPCNQLRQFVDLFLAPLTPLLRKISADTQPNADPLRLPSYVHGLPEIDTFDQVLAQPDSRVALAVGHSKGNLSIAAALSNLSPEQARVRCPRMSVVTFGALVQLPPSLAIERQFLGVLDGFGWLNSILPQVWIPVPWAMHTLNTALPFHVAAVTELRTCVGRSFEPSPTPMEQAVDRLCSAMRPAARSATQLQSSLLDAGVAFQGALTESWRSVFQGAAHTIRRQLVSTSLAMSSAARTRH